MSKSNEGVPVGLFRPYERSEKPAEPVKETKPVAILPPQTGVPAKKRSTFRPIGSKSSGKTVIRKGAATPTRKEAEQARRERMRPVLTKKEAKTRDRQLRATKRAEAMRIDAEQPGKVLARDYIDSRRRLSQYAMPLIFTCLALSLVSGMLSPDWMVVGSVVTYGLMGALVLDLFLQWRGYRKLHNQRLPQESLKRLMGYTLNRAINPRRLRMPPPRVAIGDTI